MTLTAMAAGTAILNRAMTFSRFVVFACLP
jgi:hypothetical protein